MHSIMTECSGKSVDQRLVCSWKPRSCSRCRVFNHDGDHCPRDQQERATAKEAPKNQRDKSVRVYKQKDKPKQSSSVPEQSNPPKGAVDGGSKQNVEGGWVPARNSK